MRWWQISDSFFSCATQFKFMGWVIESSEIWLVQTSSISRWLLLLRLPEEPQRSTGQRYLLAHVNASMKSIRCTRFLKREQILQSLKICRAPHLNFNPYFTAPRTTVRYSSTQAIPASRRPLPSISSFSKNKSAAYYATAVLIGFLGLTYAAVPIYRVVCQKTGWGGTPMTDSSKFSAEHMVPVPTVNGRRIKVSFSASTSDSLPWSFRPQQREISVLPGETALTFYKAKNKSNEDIIGIATYNVSFSISSNWYFF